MKVVVNKDLCIGCGSCVSVCPQVFSLDEESKSQPKDPQGCEGADCCQEAAESCPVEAITFS